MPGVGAWGSTALTLCSPEEHTRHRWWHCYGYTHLTCDLGRSHHLLLVLVMSWESEETLTDSSDEPLIRLKLDLGACAWKNVTPCGEIGLEQARVSLKIHKTAETNAHTHTLGGKIIHLLHGMLHCMTSVKFTFLNGIFGSAGTKSPDWDVNYFWETKSF